MEILSRVIYFLLFDSALPCGSLLVWHLKKKKKNCTEIMNITLSNLVLILTKGGVKKKS